jgi:F-type H+-transporting ATPase subunit delta
MLTSELNAERKNFLLLLVQKKRLNVLAEISQRFNVYYATLEKMSKVRVVTAVATQEDSRKKLADALTKRIRRQVTLECEVDPSIIGGAVIHIGDQVIDGSIRRQLARLFESLTG